MTNLQCKCLEMNLLTSGEYYGHFLFTDLEGGDGSTLANMVRRALLSSLIESKIIGVRFAGVSDEFSSMEGVREDLLEIMLNLKEIIIKNPSYEPCYGRIKVFGPAIVTANSLILPPNVTVVNPRSHILTICEESLVELEVRIEPGKIYTFPQNRKAEGSGNFLNVDANFTPVLKVNSYIQALSQEVEPLSQSIKNNTEELHIEIYTNGAILPHQALMIAGNKLGSMILAFQNIIFPKSVELKTDGGIQEEKKKILAKKALWLQYKKLELKRKDVKKNPISKKDMELPEVIFEGNKGSQNKSNSLLASTKMVKEPKKEKYTPVKQAKQNLELEARSGEKDNLETLGLSKRIIKILKKSKIFNIEDLRKISNFEPSQLEKIKGLGVMSIAEIHTKLNLLSVT